MKFLIAVTAATALIVTLGLGIAGAQQGQNTNGSVSLGDLARQLKTDRAKSGAKAKVITNDDLSSPSSAAEEPTSSPAKAPPNRAGGRQTHGEKYFRDQMHELQDRLDMDRRELNVLEQKLGQGELVYYPNPYQTLLQESGPTALSDVKGLQERIDKKKEDVAADEKAIENLKEQLRRDGGDPGWLREAASQPGNTVETPHLKAEPGSKEYWQARFKFARAQLALAKERQQLAEDELNLLQIQEVRELNSEVKAELAEKIQAKQRELAECRAATEAAQKSVQALQNEFKTSGAPDAWSETEE